MLCSSSEPCVLQNLLLYTFKAAKALVNNVSNIR